MIKVRLCSYMPFLVVSLNFFISIDIYGMLKLQTLHSEEVAREVIKNVVHVSDHQTTDSFNTYVLECAQSNDINAQLIIGLTYRTAKDKPCCEKAVEWLRRAAYQGDARAQFHLGICYSRGLGVKKDNEEAMKWFLYADQGVFIPAQFLMMEDSKDSFFDKQKQEKSLERGVRAYKEEAKLKKYDELVQFGLSCEYGDGVKKNIVVACESYMKAAHHDTRYLNHLVRCYEYANKEVPVYKEILVLLQKNPDFYYLLGVAYFYGIGCSKNLEIAKKMLESAAEYTHGCAQHCLADLFVNEGVSADVQHSSVVKYRKAMESLYEQAEKGWADAQLYLGLCYFDGKGVEKDYEEALAWLLKAANQNSPEAQYHIGQAGLNGYGCIKTEKIAYGWLLKSAENGYTKAKYLVGWLLAYGSEIKHDDKIANEWLEQASQDGHMESQYLIALRCSQALGMAYSDSKVIKWMEKAALNGHKQAQYLLGTYYEDGLHTKLDYEKSFSWFSQASLPSSSSPRGHTYAKFRHGFAISFGRGCKKDEKLAAKECESVIAEIESDAQAGKPEAQNLLGLAFKYGLGKAKDLGIAKTWFEKAAKQGYWAAQHNLASMCIVDKDKDLVIDMFCLAAQQGSPYAMHSMGVLFQSIEKKERVAALQRALVWDIVSVTVGIMVLPIIGTRGLGESVARFASDMAMMSSREWFANSVNLFTIAARRGLTEGFKSLEKLYKGGDKSAYINYAICLYYGWGCDRDHERAAQVLQKAVDLNIPLAKGNLGECYYYGRGVKQDYKKAIELFESPDVDSGDALFYLGECYYFGYGIPKNYEKAVQLYGRASQKNNAKAAYKYALCHLDGAGVERNEKRAQELFQDAVKLLREHIDYDDDLEITYLAYCYEKGLGVMQDYTQAAELYEKAARNDEYTAQISLGYLYNHGYGVEQNFKKAFDLYEKAAKHDRPEGKFSLGEFYEYGLEGVIQPDHEQAMKWYHLAIEHGSNEARLRLGIMYEKQKDFKDAFILYKEAAGTGVVEAQYRLGKCYQDGLGAEKDIVQAKRWLGKAERNGYNPK